MIEIAAGLLTGLIACVLVRLGLSAHVRRTLMLKHYRNRFLQDAERLVLQDELTDGQLARLQRMTGDLDGSTGFRALESVVATTSADLKRTGHSPDGPIVSPEWGSLIDSYLLALTYLRSIRGWIIRAKLANILDPRFGANEAEAIDVRLHGNATFQRT